MSWPAAVLEVGGGRLSLSPLPDAEGLRALAAAGVTTLLSLTEPAEEVAAGRPDFAAEVQAAGLSHLRLPVQDYDIPRGGAAVLQEALGELSGGGHLALHCKGGCGRSGMIALRLMRMAGEAADPALARLRAARPCAIETPDQEAWARADGD